MIGYIKKKYMTGRVFSVLLCGIFAFVLLLAENPSYAKRRAPMPVAPVIHGIVEYRAPMDWVPIDRDKWGLSRHGI
jgi:hypothetical protein